ncbi:MAG: HEPN domain-containing protein [Anaerolineales bacterium]|nr:HEPN domain-containing protein [Anaerolineales bacterium]
MEIPNENNILVEFVWGDLPFRQDYTQIGSFQSDAPDWPRIYVTVPIKWAEAHSESLNDFVIIMTKEFIRKFNEGVIKENLGKLELWQFPNVGEKIDIKISIHKDAVSRFNEEGITLVSLCQKGGYFLKTKPQNQSNFPDMYVHGELTNENIASFKMGMKNGFGDELARYFENSQIGLEADNYKRFVKFCESIERAIKPRSTISRKVIEEYVFKWIEERFNKLTSIDLIEFLIPNLEREIEEFEIWVPIAELRTSKTIPVGKIEITPMTAEWLSQWQEVSLSNTPPDAYEGKVIFFREQITKPFQGWAAGVIKIRADKEAAMQIAYYETERALALLRFFSIAALTPKVTSYVAMMGRENIESETSLTFVNGKFRYFHTMVTDLTSYQMLSLNDEELARMNSSGMNILSDLLRKEKLTDFEEKILDSITLYSNAIREKNLANKILYILTSLENIFLQNETEPIIVNLRDRVANLIGKDLAEKKGIIKNITTIYGLRSKFIHHAEKISDLEELEQFFPHAFVALASTVQKANIFSTMKEFISSLDDKKLS